jgi:hypothetical protein
MFGFPVGFNIQGSSTANTSLGGCCSIAVKVIIWIYVLLNFKKLVLLEGDSILTQFYYEDLADTEVALNDTHLLLFWTVEKTSDGSLPIFLNEENLDKKI